MKKMWNDTPPLPSDCLRIGLLRSMVVPRTIQKPTPGKRSIGSVTIKIWEPFSKRVRSTTFPTILASVPARFATISLLVLWR